MTTQEDEFLSDTIVNLDRLPVLGKHIKIQADLAQLDNIADAVKISSVGRLSAQIHVVRVQGGVKVSGKLYAEITQPCVITLEAVHQKIDIELDRVFMPNPGKTSQNIEKSSAKNENAPGSETYVDLSEESMPDYFEGAELDVGDFLLESFAMAIDLYPRLPGAKMNEKQFGDDPSELSPFAVLKDLN